MCHAVMYLYPHISEHLTETGIINSEWLRHTGKVTKNIFRTGIIFNVAETATQPHSTRSAKT